MDKNIHSGHRERLRKRFVSDGLGSFEQHEVLELLLYQLIPYKDTNELAHKLIDKFGSLSSVLEAPLSELKSVDGLSDTTAANLSLFYPLFRYYKDNKFLGQKLINMSQIYPLAVYLLSDSRFEEIIVVCLDSSGYICGKKSFTDNNINKVNITPRQISETAFGYNSTHIILVHSHPKGIAQPSSADLQFTNMLYAVLRGLGIQLLEHIIIAGESYYSFFEKGLMSKYYQEYNKNFNALGVYQEEIKLDGESN